MINFPPDRFENLTPDEIMSLPTLDEAFDIAWSNAQKGLYSVIESDTHAIYINCDLFDEYTTDIYDLMRA